MHIFVTGICGFVGSSLARYLRKAMPDATLSGIDSLLRPGSQLNRAELQSLGIRVLHGDVRLASDLENLPGADWVVDAAANPSVLAGVDGRSSSRQLVEHNLIGTLNVLEYCKKHSAGLFLLSTSRVYSIAAQATIPIRVEEDAFTLDLRAPWPAGLSAAGIGESFSTASPVSLYGSTKLASEALALEYGAAFSFPVWVNRCGVLAGAGQFGTAEQGIFSFWMHAHAARRPLRYTGFGGHGYQVRDALHPEDLAALLIKQMADTGGDSDRIFNVAGGVPNSISLAQLTRHCDNRFGPHTPTAAEGNRPFDLPWIVLDSSRVTARFGWSPQRFLPSILGEIATHVLSHPQWLEVSSGTEKA